MDCVRPDDAYRGPGISNWGTAGGGVGGRWISRVSMGSDVSGSDVSGSDVRSVLRMSDVRMSDVSVSDVRGFFGHECVRFRAGGRECRGGCRLSTRGVLVRSSNGI